MIRTRLLAALAAVAVVAGCGGGSGATKPDAKAASKAAGGSSTTPTTAPLTTAPAAPPSPERMRSVLLTVSDMPPGWAAGLGANDGEDSTTNTDDFVCPGAKEKFPQEFSHSADAGLDATFNKSQFGPFVIEALAAFDDTQATFSQAEAALRSCAGQHWDQTDPDGTKTSFTLNEVSTADRGDDHFAYRLSGTSDGAAMTIDLVFVRDGPVVALVAGIGITSMFGNGQLDAAEFEKILDAVATKLAKV